MKEQETLCEGSICVRYRREKYNRWVYLWDQWKPIELWGSPWRYWRGNMYLGFWSGLRANLTLWSPLLNKLVHWKHRNSSLGLNIGGVPTSLGKLK